MINLMPYEDQKQTKAARSNVTLIRYVLVMLFAIAFLAMGCGVTYLTITGVQEVNENTVKKSANKAVNTSANDEVTIRTNLQSARSVLDQRVNYGEILTSLANALPQDTVVDSLSLNDNSFGSPMSVKIKVKSTDVEPRLKTALTSTYFSGYEMKLTAPNPDGSSAYKFVLTVNLVFNKVIN